MNMRPYYFLVSALLFSGLYPAAAWADGKAWIYRGQDRSSAQPVMENEQRAAIVHKDGLQRMLLAINIETKDQDQAVWMFPVPGKPAEVEVNLSDEFPKFEGKNSYAAARKYVSTVLDLALWTQIYPLALCCSSTALGLKVSPSSSTQPANVIHEVNKYGLTTKVIQADSTASLAEYFQQNQVNMPPEQLASFEPYTKGGYAFVVTWITSVDELHKVFPDLAKDAKGFVARRPCVYVQFPSKDIFYPMRPTAAYGDERVPLILYIFDYVKPIQLENAGNMEIGYYRQTRMDNLPQTFEEYLGRSNYLYTRIRSSMPANNYREDLAFTPAPVYGQRFSDLLADISENPHLAVILGFLVVLALSYVSSGLAGFLLHRDWMGYAGYGFYTLLTIVMYCHMLKQKFPEDSADAKVNARNREKRKQTTIAFSAIFFTMGTLLNIWVLWVLPTPPRL